MFIIMELGAPVKKVGLWSAVLGAPIGGAERRSCR
jgi:hypothetical protein